MEQLQLQFQTQLGSLMQQSPRPNPNLPTATLASGIPTALHVRSSNPSWVLDSGANDHMTSELSLFTSHMSSIDQFVRIANGSAVHVRSKGKVCLSSQLTLSSVLYVPDFAYNLLSDQNSKKIFGKGYEWNGLYYFGDPPDSLLSMSLQASVLPSLESMSFSLTSLKLIYIPRMHRTLAAFDIIHSDVWEPSPVTSLSGHRYYMIKTQTTVRTLRSDNGQEYVSNDFRSALSQHGLLQQFSCPYTPEHNGVAERKNRSIMTIVRCLLCGMHVPKHFWNMAVLTATITCSTVLLAGFSLAHLIRLIPVRDRLLRIRVCFLILFRCLSPLTWLLPLFRRSLLLIHAICTLAVHLPQIPCRNLLRNLGLSDSYQTFIGHVSSTPIPRSVSETLRDPNWVTARQVEMAALQQNHTWDLVSLSWGVQTIGCKWVFTVKYLADGIIERYKARLVAKGFTQVPGQDYGATFAPVAKLTTVHVIISLAASYSWPLHQLNVKNAFLNGDLHETIYMDPPPGFRAEGEHTGKICRLWKSLYGLKQSPRAWFSRFSEVVLSLDFIRCQSDQTCFIHRRSDGQCVNISVYVDDIIITGDDASGIERVKQTLRKAFDTKDLGPLRYFLKIEDTGMMGCRPASSPMDPNFKLSPESGDLLPDATQYQHLVGRLIYLTHTRPDISFAVSVVSQFMHATRTSHLDVVHHILQYLKTCPGLRLFYTSKEQCGVSCFTDADYAGSKTNFRSTSELGFPAASSSTLFCDNKSAIMLASDSILHERTKHIEVDVHFIRKKVRSEVITPHFVPSSEQAADMFTKSIGPSLLKISLSKLGLVDIFAPA
ncbi:hypothetical protein Acr_10g0007850 [Actinidia rufa]|uniref:Integrase catalytic domain-containing protein n=1 Tax=Actinidia rufa TaxID=165716 RepID=A0A7J0F9M7_9ERIC|nr:hypothetical protein Acr_10g0007850 [Actinidia rufa]